ncbi:hypothetical protein BAUCODRAFT_102852 [Baudoinia panamericana UAMH 10762]|uniref:U3 small nucleolar RNA-associated protein 22 n=1 Tax=Baudoinia panamericana (strain UAMH 10762) TaxID=717646 RepID=M2NLG7_BAUPA|nr:uncharacterized protein BAUCODRAFT_102852 [Baudoinia panamericana UAMH 10762]EMD00335.1 hypothetical protein BAUCODRAFT_102852 [Baudoinia panamericana UAMH 10762]
MSPTNGLAYTTGASRSNMFRLQVDELLQQIRPRRGKREDAAEKALHALKAALDESTAKPALSIDEAERELLRNKIAIPFPQPRPPDDAKYKLEFAKPANVNVVGSYAMQTISRSRDDLVIDMTVAMPSSLFHEKDYLNYRYFYKRAYYLACLASTLREAATPCNVRFDDFHGDPLKPILVISKSVKSIVSEELKPSPKWRINIIPCTDSVVFPAEKLTSEKNCVRPTHNAKPEPTPFYNSSLRADMLMLSYLRLLHGAETSCAAFKDACLLGSTWLRQRGFGSHIAGGGFGHFEWATFVALLLQGGGPNGKSILSEGYSSYQLFKGTLQVLAVRDLGKQPIVVGSGTFKSVANGSPMLWDSARVHNVLYKVAPWGYARLRQDAKTTIAMLGDQLFDGFDATFVLRTDDALMRFDCVVSVPASALTVVDDGRPAYRTLYDVLSRGLGDRVSQISIRPPESGAWDVDSSRPRDHVQASVIIGLIYDPDTVNRTVDHGPSAESKAEAASFRKFWGEKAEMRRFKDGSILESLVWGASGKTIVEQIVRYLLERHFSDRVEREATFFGGGFNRLLRGSLSVSAFQPIMDSFKQLETDIRGLDGLPLSIRQIMPASAQLRYATIQPSAGVANGRQSIPADVTIQFEGSVRWPDDLVAIQRTKLAFLLKLSELLQEAHDQPKTRIGLENHEQDIFNQAYLDIMYESGTSFRMRVYHDREQTLLERQMRDKSLAPSAKEAAALGLAAYKRLYLKAPPHTQAVARLCSRYPALSGTIRLLKKWFASHLLANHVGEEVIELMAARIFVQPWPWQTPSSVQTGFLRTLHWLARWDWRTDPLIVDLSGSGELRIPDVDAIKTRFEAWRKLDPSLTRIVLFAASNIDKEGTTWSDGRPQKVVARRMTALAKAACAEVEQNGLQVDPASLFSSPVSDFDFVLHLHPSMTGGKRSKDAARYKNLELAALSDQTLVGFEPTQSLLEELESLYGSALLFFSGSSERPVIAGLWSPQTAPRAWKVNLAYSTIPHKKSKTQEVQAVVNREAMLAEIARVGRDLVGRVEINDR